MSQYGSPVRSFFRISICFAALIALAPFAQGARGGGLSGGESQFGLVAGVSQSAQDQINTLISRANSRSTSGPVNTPALNSAWELGLQYGYRFSGTMFAMIVRPTYFFENATGSGKDGSYNYGVTGFTIF